MKNLKFLVLTVCAIMLLSFAAFASDVEARDFSFENGLATDLKALGLFSGVSDNDFDLERVPTRTEVLVMLIRVLGEEKDALEGEWEHPFTDVPAWADKYVGYAYENGLTKGVSATKFGTDNASATTYLTFMLRALGYSDADGDFAWDAPHTLAKGLGMLPTAVDTENFLRADIVTVSYAALSVNLKGTTTLLAEKLIEKEAFTADVYGKTYRATKLTDKENEGKTALTAEQLFEKCSSAVVCLNTYDENGELTWTGSGFFIDESGIGVTTYYVIDGATRVEAVMPASGAKYDVTGILDYSGRYDWVIFKVDGENFPTLPLNPMPVKGASTVYAIGSPEGLENTVSQGIVSNARRVMYDDFAYIQTTAQIGDGSIGGPLVNSFGEVIGIVHDYDYDGQNINYALPVSAIAAAKTSEVTPYADYDWNSVWYYTDTDEVTVKVGEAVEYEFDFDYITADYDVPTLKATSADSSIAVATLGVRYGTLRITGNKAGTVDVTISDDYSKDTYTVKVTVEENPEITEPKVTYNTDISELKMSKGAEKSFLVEIVEYGVTDTPDGTLAAQYTIKSSTTKIKVEHEFATPDDEEKYPEFAGKSLPYLGIKVKGERDTTGEITISNDKTGDTLVIPVTVGNRYESAYLELVKAITEGEFDLEEDGIKPVEHVVDEANPENEHYVRAIPSNLNGECAFYYYPVSGDIVFRILVKEEQTTVDFSFIWTKEELTKYELTATVLGINMKCASEVDAPSSFAKDINKMKHDVFECPDALKAQMLPSFNQVVATYVCLLDAVFLPVFSDGLDMTDFGYINIDSVTEQL